MSRFPGVRLQAGLVILLFLASLATATISTIQTLQLPRGQEQVQQRLRQASRGMSEAGEAAIDSISPSTPDRFELLNSKLREISERELDNFPGVEGGFYLSEGADRFAGFGFPTRGPEPSLREQAPQIARSDDPPPREGPFILFQAQHSLSLPPGEYHFDIRTVGTSRVAILTQPVGAARPARAATWLMFRLTRPEDLANQLTRFQLSTGLALGGIGLAAVLTVNLLRTLKRQRADQEKLRDELRRSEHLAALGKLLAGVAHEVRNPLAGIRSTVQLWERMPETAHSARSMDAVIHAVDRLNKIVTRLLYFSRADSAERLSVNVNQLVRETLDLLSAQATTQQVRIETELDEKAPMLSGAGNALRQVFLNLATNALQAMPSGGVLRCTTRWNQEGKAVEVRFQDTGPGISSEDQKHLFEPFFTTRPEGTGLGLALCREIVLQHGGKIDLEPSAGTCFRVCLPVSE